MSGFIRFSKLLSFTSAILVCGSLVSKPAQCQGNDEAQRVSATPMAHVDFRDHATLLDYADPGFASFLNRLGFQAEFPLPADPKDANYTARIHESLSMIDESYRDGFVNLIHELVSNGFDVFEPSENHPVVAYSFEVICSMIQAEQERGIRFFTYPELPSSLKEYMFGIPSWMILVFALSDVKDYTEMDDETRDDYNPRRVKEMFSEIYDTFLNDGEGQDVFVNRLFREMCQDEFSSKNKDEFAAVLRELGQVNAPEVMDSMHLLIEGLNSATAALQAQMERSQLEDEDIVIGTDVVLKPTTVDLTHITPEQLQLQQGETIELHPHNAPEIQEESHLQEMGYEIIDFSDTEGSDQVIQTILDQLYRLFQ